MFPRHKSRENFTGRTLTLICEVVCKNGDWRNSTKPQLLTMAIKSSVRAAGLSGMCISCTTLQPSSSTLASVESSLRWCVWLLDTIAHLKLDLGQLSDTDLILFPCISVFGQQP